MDRSCYLVLGINGKGRTLLAKNGTIKEYRHAWQIKKWLKEQYGIDDEEMQ